MVERLPLPAAPESFNFLAQVVQPAAQPARQPIAQPKQPSKFKNALGAILDGLAVAGGAQPGYSTTRARITQQERQAMVQQARQRLAANPDDQEAFAFLFEESPADAVATRNALRPAGPKYEKVGNELVEIGPGGVRSVFKGESPVSPSGDIQLLEALTARLGDPRKALELFTSLKLPPEFKTVNRGDGGVEGFIFNRAPGVPASPDAVFEAMIGVESGGRQFDAQGRPLTSPKGAIGVAQVMPSTAPEAARLAGVAFDENRYRTDPEYNKLLGRAYFGEMLRQFGDPARAAAAYNAGPEAVRRAVQRGGDNWLSLLPRETQQYVPAVLGGVAGGPGVRKVVQTPDATPEPPKGASDKGKKDSSPRQALQVLDEGIKDLQRAVGLLKSGRNITGPLLGITPDPVLNFTNPETVTAGEAVARVSQKELRQILGGQFAAKEGEQLIKRAFNPGQDEGENVLRVESLLRQLQARRDEIAASMQGGPPVKVDSPEAAALLPAGSRFVTPDGQVRVKR